MKKNGATRPPSFQFYSLDWLGDLGVRALPREWRGTWIDVLCYMDRATPRGYFLINGAPPAPEAAARILGLTVEEATQLKPILVDVYNVASFDEERGALYSRRMVRDEHLREIRREAGKQGGNPALINRGQGDLFGGEEDTPPPPPPAPTGTEDANKQLEAIALMWEKHAFNRAPRHVFIAKDQKELIIKAIEVLGFDFCKRDLAHVLKTDSPSTFNFVAVRWRNRLKAAPENAQAAAAATGKKTAQTAPPRPRKFNLDEEAPVPSEKGKVKR